MFLSTPPELGQGRPLVAGLGLVDSHELADGVLGNAERCDLPLAVLATAALSREQHKLFFQLVADDLHPGEVLDVLAALLDLDLAEEDVAMETRRQVLDDLAPLGHARQAVDFG